MIQQLAEVPGGHNLHVLSTKQHPHEVLLASYYIVVLADRRRYSDLRWQAWVY